MMAVNILLSDRRGDSLVYSARPESGYGDRFRLLDQEQELGLPNVQNATRALCRPARRRTQYSRRRRPRPKSRTPPLSWASILDSH
jgi:hypothetical protein